jgi:hypothetical protein
MRIRGFEALSGASLDLEGGSKDPLLRAADG